MWKFAGGVPELKQRVQLTGIRGKWSVKQRPNGNLHTFTTDDGLATMTWAIGEEPEFTGGDDATGRLQKAFWGAHREIRERHERLIKRRNARFSAG